MTDPPDLEKLISASASGDRAAFERLYLATSGKLFAVVLRILRQRESAEDALQAAYLKIWRNAGEYQPSKGAPMTWLIAIARNQAIDRRRRRDQVVISDNPEEAASAGATPLDSPDVRVSHAQSRALEDCLRALKPEQRRCIELAYCDGYSHRELSDQLKTSLGTVKSWIRRGLLSLKECLKS